MYVAVLQSSTALGVSRWEQSVTYKCRVFYPLTRIWNEMYSVQQEEGETLESAEPAVIVNMPSFSPYRWRL